jgi:hypothetical protein
VCRVEHAQLVLLPVADPIGEQHADILERRAIGSERVLHHPLTERLGDDGPRVVDAHAVAQPRAIGFGRGRCDAVHHRIREHAVVLHPPRQRRIEAGRGLERGSPRGGPVAREVVAAEDRERTRATIAPRAERGGDAVERRTRAGRRRLRIARLGDRQGDDRRRGRCDQVCDSRIAAAVRRVHERDDRPDHLC